VDKFFVSGVEVNGGFIVGVGGSFLRFSELFFGGVEFSFESRDFFHEFIEFGSVQGGGDGHVQVEGM